MNQSLRAIVQLMTGVCAIAAFVAWVLPLHADVIVWTCRVLIPLATIALGVVLFRVSRKADLAPDLLGQRFATYFERDGLCFAPSLGVQPADRTCWFGVTFQNRYAGPCTCDLVIQPGGKSFRLGRHEVPTVAVGIECPGGGVGVVRVPYPIPAKYQGANMRYEIAARTRYPAGAGQMLRFREGLRVGSHQHAVGRAAVTLGLAAVGVISIRKPASITVTLPSGVSESVPPGASIQSEILWAHDAPTGGFPVVQRAGGAATADA